MLKSREVIEIVEKELKEQKMSKKELAHKIGCSERSIQYWIKGNRETSINMADKVLKALGKVVILGKEEKQ